MTDLRQHIEQNILGRHLLNRGKPILVAVSGGLDSMTLLTLLHDLSARHGWELTVAHFNHQLRGQSSDADEKLVHRTAAALKLPFVVDRADVRRFAGQSKLSIEMAARKLRHEFLARAAKQRKISSIALAHHADDQVELFFLRLLRGAGSEGLAGMKWRSPSPADEKVMLIRPLLDATKLELRAFAREKKIQFREDATNAGLDMPRNRVRNELLPLLRRRYQPALARAILRLMDIVGSEADLVAQAARDWIGRRPDDESQSGVGKRKAKESKARCVSKAPHVVSSFETLPIAVQRRVLQLRLLELNISADFELIERLRCSKDVSISVSPGFSIMRNSAGSLKLQTPMSGGFKVNEVTVNLQGGAGEVEFGGYGFCWDFQAAKKSLKPGKTRGRELFDADKIGGKITLRHWRPGDRFQPIGLKSAVKLQDLFTNQKIPRAQRHELIVAEAANGAIFWVQNLRMAERFKLTRGTKRCLVWRWRYHSS